MSKSRALLTGLTALAVTAFSAPAMAVSWGTIVVYEDKVEQGRAYGTFFNKNYQYAAMNANYRDSRPGGNGVFVDIDYLAWMSLCGECDPKYAFRGSDQTGRTTSGKWVGPDQETNPLEEESSRARGAIQVCEDQSWSPDPCSEPDALPTFSY